MENAIHQYADEALEALGGSEPDWIAASDKWLELSLVSKGTSWESAVDWIGDSLRARDLEGFKKALTALRATSDL